VRHSRFKHRHNALAKHEYDRVVVPVALPAYMADLRKYLVAIKRPDISLSFDKGQAFEYAFENVPATVQEQYEQQFDCGALVLDGWCLVAPGINKIKSIVGTDYVTWWYIYTYRTMSNYPHAPDEMETLPLADCQSVHEALRIALLEVVRNELDRAWDGLCADEQAKAYCADVPQ